MWQPKVRQSDFYLKFNQFSQTSVCWFPHLVLADYFSEVELYLKTKRSGELYRGYDVKTDWGYKYSQMSITSWFINGLSMGLKDAFSSFTIHQQFFKLHLNTSQPSGFFFAFWYDHWEQSTFHNSRQPLCSVS